MKNTGILLILVGLYVVINSGSFRDLVLGKAKINFVNPSGNSGSNVAPNPSPGAGSGGSQTHKES